MPLLVGAPVASCPTWMGLTDPDVLLWGEALPDWARAPQLSLPPRARSVVRLWTEWESLRLKAEADERAAERERHGR